MELEAAIAALGYLQGRHAGAKIDLHTDSEYLRQGITRWIEGWFARGWITKSGQSVKNRDLWETLHALTSRAKICWHWVKGHDGNPLNERVDLLATEARLRLSPAAPARAASQPEKAPAHTTLSVAVSGRGSAVGWAAVLREGESSRVLRGRAVDTTTNAVLIRAATEGLRALDAPGEVSACTVSDYLAKGAADWVHGWKRRGWRTKGGQAVSNRPEWEALLDAAQRHQVRWQIARDPLPKDLEMARKTAQEELGR